MNSLIRSARNRPLATTSGDPFEAVFERCWTPIYAVVYRILGDPDDAEDVVLDAFLKLHDTPKLLTAGQNPKAWLYRVATRRALNVLRANKRRKSYEGQSEWHQSRSTIDPSQAVQSEESRAQVRQVLAAIKPKDARLLMLRHSGLSYTEISEVLSVSKNSIGTMLARAQKTFRQRYQNLFPQEFEDQ
jgi:RNA polymerase sigma factor (sigma-70 family)